MIRLGFHVSISQGFARVVARALERQCETMQVFSRNPRGWKYKSLDPDDCAAYKKNLAETGIRPVFIHMPYLPNLASDRTGLQALSVASLTEELQRARALDAGYLVMHAGSSTDAGSGVRRMAEGINRALSSAKGGAKILLENTAGRGSEIGYRFEHLADIISGVHDRSRIGVAFDTAHAFEAGYDLRTKKAVDGTLREFDRVVGLKMIMLVHFNDSRTPLASRRDRHEHIGRGEIGAGMAHIASHEALDDLPFIMETPRMTVEDDLMNMTAAKRLLARGPGPGRV